MDPFAIMVEPIRIKDQFSLISGTKSIQDDTNIVSADDGGDDSDIAEPDPDDPDAIEDFEVREMITYCLGEEDIFMCKLILSGEWSY